MSLPTPDRSALAMLYTTHHPWLHSWLHRRLGNSHDAADLTQDTFIRLMTGLQLQSLREPRAFLTTLAQRVLIDFWRRRELERAYLDSLAALPEPQVPSEESRALVLEALTQIDRMLSRLPAKARAAFLLSQLDGLSYPQIADRLAVAEISVRRYMKQAIAACVAAQSEGAAA